MVDVAGSKRLVADVKQVFGELAALCVGVEPGDLLASDASRLIEMSGAFDRQSAGLRALALDRALEAKVWRDEGFRSPQRYVAAKLGVTVAEAARIVATAERLRSQPKTREAMRKGELSDDEADAVSGANEAEPEREDEHLGAATGGASGSGSGRGSGTGPASGPGSGSGPGPVPGSGGGPRPDAGSGGDRPRESVAELRRRRERAKARADRDAKEREERLHRERTASMGTTSEGGWYLSSRNTKAAGQRIDQALTAAMDELRAERRAAGLPALTYGQMLADALVRVADKALGTVHEAAAGAPARRAMGSRRRGLLLCDLSGLRRGWLEGEQTCEIAGFGTVSLAAARELLGEGLLSLVLKDGRDVVNVTPLADFTDLQRDAIWARAMGVCEVPGCGCTVGLEIDHDHERQHGGPSTIANASLKCRQHHQDKTHGPKRLIGPPGRRAWIDLHQLPFDPARDGPIPLEHIEHLLPPEAPSPTARAGPAPPRAAEAPSVDTPSMADGEQLDLLTC